MKQPVSVFIMDVTNSTSAGDEVTTYLKEWERDINSWGNQNIIIKAKHRMGDEILLVSNHYATAYIIAFYMQLIWRFQEQKPYFGISFGHIEGDLEAIDIEWWNHSLVKKARIANEKIKNKTSRDTSIVFNIGEEVVNYKSGNHYKNTINLFALMQSKLLGKQTVNQKLICSLYAIFGEQKRIAHELSRTSATISSHFKKGESEMVFTIFKQLQELLIILETINKEDKEEVSLIVEEVNTIIRAYIKSHLNRFYPQLATETK